MSLLKAVHIVHMKYCPHCILALHEFGVSARALRIPCRLYDVDSEMDARSADEIVRKYGDWSVDYIVPQVFFETNDGKMLHALTGYPEGLQFTKRAIDNLLDSGIFRQLADGGTGHLSNLIETSRSSQAGTGPTSTCTIEGSCSRRQHRQEAVTMGRTVGE